MHSAADSAGSRGAAVQMAAGLVLAEFDNAMGSCVRAYYPKTQPGSPTTATDAKAGLLRSFLRAVQRDQLAGSMLPDGAEKQGVTRVVLLVNRPPAPSHVTLPVYYYTRDGDSWVRDTTADAPAPLATASHQLRLHRTRALLSLCCGEAAVWADMAVTLDAVRVSGDVPPEAQGFARTLDLQAFLQGDGAVTDAAATSAESRYVFVTVHTAERQVGFLMHVLHAQEVERVLRSTLQPPVSPRDIVVEHVTDHDDAADGENATTSDDAGAQETKTETRTDSPLSPTLGAVTDPKTLSHDEAAAAVVSFEKAASSVQVVSNDTTAEDECDAERAETLYGLCAVVSKHSSAARRGGVTKAVAVLGQRLGWLEPFYPLLVEAVQYCCDVPGSDRDATQQQTKVLKLCYDAIQGAGALLAAPDTAGDVTYRDAPFGTVHRMTLPRAPCTADMTFTRGGLERLLEVVGVGLMHLLHGILTGRRILVLSRRGSATDVCEATFALGLLGDALDRDFVARRVFPYVSVSHAEALMRVPGYVAGTLNPIFADPKAWNWQLLCDLDRGVVVDADAGDGATLSPTTMTSGWAAAAAAVTLSTTNFLTHAILGGTGATGDAALDAQTLHLYGDMRDSVCHMRALRLAPEERSRRLRGMVEEFTHVTLLVGAVVGADAAAEEVLHRSAALRAGFCTPAMASVRARWQMAFPFNSIVDTVLGAHEPPALLLACAALRRCRGESTQGLLWLLEQLTGMLTSGERVRMLLRRMPVALDGLNPIGIQLTHPSCEVRGAALALLAKVETEPEGRSAIAAMSSFLLFIYEDSRQRMMRVSPAT